MARILLLFAHTQNQRLLADWLAPDHEVLDGEAYPDLNLPIDLGIVDGPALQRWQQEIQLRKEAEEPVMLPFLLITPRQEMTIARHDLWHRVDDMVAAPVEKGELNARVSLLLQARRYSAQLRQRNDDLQAMVHALNHDLRAPARISAGFAKLLLDEYGPQLDDQARHYIQRIRDANEHSRRLLNRLLDFAQLGRESIAIQRVELDQVVTVILNNISDIRHDAQIFINRPLSTVQANFGLLELALTNLFANALKYVAPGASPHVTFTATVDNGLCRITVADRGIGIPAEEQGRIFQPFVRLHGEESYPGAGLGLAAASKAVQLMGGRIGVESKPGTGSTFWIILPVGA